MSDYIVKRVDGHGMSLTNLKLRPTLTFEVRHTDDAFCWRGETYFTDSLTSRQIGGMKMAATKMAKRYQEHLDRTGQRFEIERMKEEQAKAAIEKRKKRIAYLLKHIPELQAERDRLIQEDQA